MPQASPAKYTELLCVFSKWCDTVASSLDGQTTPNTAVIFWAKVPPGPWQAHFGRHSEVFTIYTNLSQLDSKVKELARLVRQKHLEEILGDLGIEPKANSPNIIAKNTKWGHCAETLALTRWGRFLLVTWSVHC